MWLKTGYIKSIYDSSWQTGDMMPLTVDGGQMTQAMSSSGITDFPKFEHCWKHFG